jgi:hypothetical protein
MYVPVNSTDILHVADFTIAAAAEAQPEENNLTIAAAAEAQPAENNVDVLTVPVEAQPNSGDPFRAITSLGIPLLSEREAMETATHGEGGALCDLLLRYSLRL